MAQDENPNPNPNPYFYEARTADELLFGIYDHVDWLTPEVMDDMIRQRQANREAQQQEQRPSEDENRGQPTKNDLNQATQELERADTEEEPARQIVENSERDVSSINQDLERQRNVRSVVQIQGVEEQVEEHEETRSSADASRPTMTEHQFSEMINKIIQIPEPPSSRGTSAQDSRRRPAVSAYSNSSVPSTNRHQSRDSVKRQNDPATHAVQQRSRFDEALPWIASILPDIDSGAPNRSNLGLQDSRNTRYRMQRRQSSHLTRESTRFSDRGQNCDRSAHVTPPNQVEFSSALAELRQSGISYEEICMAIELPRLPRLDDEMESDYQQQEMDCGFQRQEEKMIPWTIEESNSPTFEHIAQDVENIEGQSVISPEDLFNHLFRLSRSSFLQREEGVHLALWTHFMSSWNTEVRNFERETKEVIKWLETTFVPGNLALLMQNLVNCVERDTAVKKLVHMAKAIYNVKQGDMTVLAGFYSLMSTHRDVMESNKSLLSEKRKVDVSIKNVRSQISRTGRQPPKAKNGRGVRRDPKAIVTRESVMIDTFARTRWLIVGSADAHYAFASSVLLAAMKMQEYVQTEQRKKMNQLRAELNALKQHSRTLGVANRVTSANLVSKRVELVNMYNREIHRPVDDVENLMLKGFSETVKSLEKMKVMDLFLWIGGRIPIALTRALSAIEQIESLRGVGFVEGMVVSDIVKIREVVELEIAKNKHQRDLLQRKNDYLQVCNRIINGTGNVSDPGGALGNDAGSSHHHSQSFGTSRPGGTPGTSNHSLQQSEMPVGGDGAVGPSDDYPQGNWASGGGHDAASSIPYIERNVLPLGGDDIGYAGSGIFNSQENSFPEGLDTAGYPGAGMYYFEGNEVPTAGGGPGYVGPDTYYLQGSEIPTGGGDTGQNNQYPQRYETPGDEDNIGPNIQYLGGNEMPAGIDSTGFIDPYLQGNGTSGEAHGPGPSMPYFEESRILSGGNGVGLFNPFPQGSGTSRGRVNSAGPLNPFPQGSGASRGRDSGGLFNPFPQGSGTPRGRDDSAGLFNRFPQGNGTSRGRDSTGRGNQYSHRNGRSGYPYYYH